MKNIYLSILFSIMLLLTACSGSSDEANTEANKNPNKQAQPKTSSSETDVRTINIIGIDKMKYVVEEGGEMIGTAGTVETAQGDSYVLLKNIDAKPGEQLRIRLTTKSQLPPKAMSHNWVLLKKDVDPSTFATLAVPAKDNGHIPADKEDQIITHTKMAGGGETVEVTFTTPDETGAYPFLCSFPAHFSAGMEGTLNIK